MDDLSCSSQWAILNCVCISHVAQPSLPCIVKTELSDDVATVHLVLMCTMSLCCTAVIPLQKPLKWSPASFGLQFIV